MRKHPQQFIRHFPKRDYKATNEKAYEKVLNDQYSAMTVDQVVTELSYLTDPNFMGRKTQFTALLRAHEHGTLAQLFRRSDRPKFKQMYREWLELQPYTIPPHAIQDRQITLGTPNIKSEPT